MQDNSPFMYAAYTVAATAYVLYAVSLWVRTKRLRRRQRGEE